MNLALFMKLLSRPGKAFSAALTILRVSGLTCPFLLPSLVLKFSSGAVLSKAIVLEILCSVGIR